LFDAQTRWYNMIVAYLMDELAARPDGVNGGSLLDHTLILVVSEVGGGNHQQKTPASTSPEALVARYKVVKP
jgi:hypothetical protein